MRRDRLAWRCGDLGKPVGIDSGCKPQRRWRDLRHVRCRAVAIRALEPYPRPTRASMDT
jgi:hypothetical protein